MKKIGEKDAEAAKILQNERTAIYEDENVKAKNEALKQKAEEIEQVRPPQGTPAPPRRPDASSGANSRRDQAYRLLRKGVRP